MPLTVRTARKSQPRNKVSTIIIAVGLLTDDRCHTKTEDERGGVDGVGIEEHRKIGGKRATDDGETEIDTSLNEQHEHIVQARHNTRYIINKYIAHSTACMYVLASTK